ncbi:AarF/ABC1/UbiB kinase family protein [Streptomyces sp. TRM64462]|uniref:ABC1 kinase family protein n=1 Tax=Streptomyces sp. TRM64462 TaxID=2741726 RepID=UPI001586CC36|nr:AarF/UbiB family protein [Streptomyces sp. TRM64462]
MRRAPRASLPAVTTAAALLRLGQILSTIAAGTARHAARRSWRRLTRRQTATESWPEELARIVERLGPAFIKFAQIASTREDVLPPRACGALKRLHDAVEPMRHEDVHRALIEHFGPDWPELLPGFHPEPVGSGSIACVYPARLRDGTRVAVKLRRPGLTDTVRRDVTILCAVFALAGRLPGLRGAPLSDMAQAVGASVLRQLDLHTEARNLALLHEDLSTLECVAVPEPVPSLCGETCVVMGFLPGVQDRVDVAGLSPQRRRALAEQTLRAVFEMLFCTGLVHCDLHPGNLRLTSTGSVVVLDAGFVYRIPEVVRENLALFFLNLGFRNGPRCAEAVLASAEQVDRHSSTDTFTQDMTRLVDRFGGTTARDFDLIAFSTELFASQRRNGIYASSEFVFPLLALLMVEQTVRRLDPDVDFQAIARPIVYRAAAGRPAGERRRKLETQEST